MEDPRLHHVGDFVTQPVKDYEEAAQPPDTFTSASPKVA
jgi:hypothetical protein